MILLGAYYVPGIFPGTEDRATNKTDENLRPPGAYLLSTDYSDSKLSE